MFGGLRFEACRANEKRRARLEAWFDPLLSTATTVGDRPPSYLVASRILVTGNLD